MNYRKNFRNAMHKIVKVLKNGFQNLGARDKNRNAHGAIVHKTPPTEDHLRDAEAAKQVIENVDRAARYLKKDRGD